MARVAGDARTRALHLRPRRTLLRDGLIAAALVIVPVFGVAYWQTAGEPTLPLLIALNVLALGLVGAAAWRYFAVGVWTDADSVSERGFVAMRRRFPRSEITGIVRARTFGHAAEPVHQLFVMGRADAVLVRMRGQFWSSVSMDALADALAVPVTVLPDVLSTRELALERPALVYWFERSRLAAAAALAISGLCAAAAALAAIVLFS
ncbi:MAG TPA: hypothetical protein VN200_05620 [Rhodoglobus sp.]|nr:hypothetical protein [Rhodoglobus sp.]